MIVADFPSSIFLNGAWRILRLETYENKVRILFAIAIFAGFCSFALPANAEGFSYFKTGNAVLEMCDSSSPIKRGACIGYITGVVDGLTALRGRHLPSNKSVGEVVDEVVKSIRRHPEDKNEAAAAIIEIAMLDVWLETRKK